MTPDRQRDRRRSREYDPDVPVCRVFLHAGADPQSLWTPQSERILKRGYFNLDRFAVYLTGCGLARPLLGALKGRELPPAIPESFLAHMQKRATRDTVDDLLKREALGRTAQALREMRQRGILLKGTALQVLRDPGIDSSLQRATGDIDLLVEPPHGLALREALLKKGFITSDESSRTAPHHLAPVHFNSVAVEIHETIMPSFWGLPERDMIAAAHPVKGLEPIYTLSPEGMLLHAGVHASAHLYSFGLKTAWDLLWVSRHFPQLDWELAARWVKQCRLPRAFWVPARALAEELSIPLPAEFLGQAPNDRREMKLETIARQRLFSSLEGPYQINPFTKTWVFMLLHESWNLRFGYLAAISGGTAAEARHNAINFQAMRPDRFINQIGAAFAQWRSYRRAFLREARATSSADSA